jgi:hypothetical protein
MPCSYTIDLARSLVLSRGWGVLTDGELLAHVRALTIDPRFVRSFHQLADLRDVADVEVSASTIREMARLNPYGDGSRRAVVVTSDVLFGMARMYQILREEPTDELEVFRKLDDALRWLGIFTSKEELICALYQMPPIPGTK